MQVQLYVLNKDAANLQALVVTWYKNRSEALTLTDDEMSADGYLVVGNDDAVITALNDAQRRDCPVYWLYAGKVRRLEMA